MNVVVIFLASYRQYLITRSVFAHGWWESRTFIFHRPFTSNWLLSYLQNGNALKSISISLVRLIANFPFNSFENSSLSSIIRYWECKQLYEVIRTLFKYMLYCKCTNVMLLQQCFLFFLLRWILFLSIPVLHSVLHNFLKDNILKKSKFRTLLSYVVPRICKEPTEY